MFSKKFLVSIIGFLLVLVGVQYLQYRQTPHEWKWSYFETLGEKPLESFPKAIYTVPVENQKFLRIGFIGDSKGNPKKGEAFNVAVLKDLLTVLKKRDVQAVFFMGDLVSGVDAKGSNELASQLKAFDQSVDTNLGDIPIFPAVSEVEMATWDGVSTFRKQFHLENSISFSDHSFAYMVAIENSFFVVIPTNDYDASQQSVETTLNPLMMVWLQNVLREASKNYKYLFVVGSEPAFPAAVSAQKAVKAHERDAFWRILTENRVLAYFSSQEPLFDRSNRHNVWQMISGGGGASPEAEEGAHPFYHCLLLTIPLEGDAPPQLEILDIRGEINDEFELVPYKPVLYQMHITKNSTQRRRD